MSHLGDNPYVGPLTFTREQSDRFFGREREARDLLSMVVSERLVVFYAQSGGGKSSLINTRLIPGLEEKGFEVLPVARVTGAAPPEEIEVDNIFVYYLLHSLDQSEGDPSRFAKMTLAEFLINLATDGERYFYDDSEEEVEEADIEYETWPRVLVIDQFEEILTTNLGEWEKREDFFAQLSDAMAADDYLWVVLTLREDFVAGLAPYAHLLPGRLRARFYMRRMGVEAALEAVKGPVRDTRPFAESVAEKLVDNLRQIHIQEPLEGNGEPILGEYVKPVQLQVVCYQLWENLKGYPHKSEITFEDMDALTGSEDWGDFIDFALAQFYEQAIARVLRDVEIDISELELRRWFNRQLITKAETRGFVYQGEEETGGLPNPAVQCLEEQFLVRSESRAGGIWYELVHDRFIWPILDANRTWYNQNPLIRDAQAWEDSDRNEDMLYRGKQLEDAWASLPYRRALGGLVAEFIEASEEMQQARKDREAKRREELKRAQELADLRSEQAEKEKQRAEEQRERAEEQEREAKRFRRLSRAFLVVCIVVVGLAVFALVAQRKAITAEKEALESLRRAVGLLGRAGFEDNPLLGLGLALELLADVPLEDEETRDEIESSVRELMGRGRLMKFGGDDVENVYIPYNSAFVFDREGAPGELYLPDEVKLVQLPNKISEVYSNPESPIFVVVYEDETDSANQEAGQIMAELRRADDDELVQQLPGQVKGVTFSEDVRYLVIHYSDRPDELRSSETGQLVQDLSGQVDWVAFSPDVSHFLVSYMDAPAELRRSASGEVVQELAGQIGEATFSEDASSIWINYTIVGREELRRTDTGEVQTIPNPIAPYQTIFSPDAVYFVVDYEQAPGELRDTVSQRVVQTLSGEVAWVQFSPDSAYFVVSYVDEAVTDDLWRTEGDEVLSLSGEVDWVQFSPDAMYLVVDYVKGDVPDELRPAGGGEALALSGEVDWVQFSPDIPYYVVNYGDATDELRRTDTDEVTPASGEITSAQFSPDGLSFVVNYADGSAELYRTETDRIVSLVDGFESAYYREGVSGVVIDYRSLPDRLYTNSASEGLLLNGEVDSVFFSPTAELPNLVVGYQDAPGEVRSTDTGEVVRKLNGTVAWVEYSPDATHFLVVYKDAASELRRTKDGELAQGISGEVAWIESSPDVAHFIVNYVDERISDELLLIEDGEVETVFEFADEVMEFTFSPDASYFWVSFDDGPAELRNLETGEVPENLSGEIDWVSFHPDAPLIVINYFDAPAELRNLETGEVLQNLSGEIDWVSFHPDAPFIVINYFDAPDELRHEETGEIAQVLAGEIDWLKFSPDLSHFVANYLDEPDELRHTETGEVVQQLSGDVLGVQFSPDSSKLIVSYSDRRPELRNIETGAIEPLPGDVESREFSTDGSYLLVNYVNEDLPKELRRTDTWELVPLSGELAWVRFSRPDSSFNPSFFVVGYSDAVAELRRGDTGEVVRQLGGRIYGNSNNVRFRGGRDAPLVVVRYDDAPPSELRRTETGEVVQRFPDQVASAHFIPDSPYLVIDYQGAMGELRQVDTGEIVLLAGEIASVQFSPNSSAFVVDYVGEGVADELYGPDVDGAVSLSNEVDQMVFSPDAGYVAVYYVAGDVPVELRRTGDGQVVPISGEIAEVYFGPASPYYVIDYENAPGELRRTDLDEIVALAGEVENVSFSQEASYLAIDYTDERDADELYNAGTGEIVQFTSEVDWVQFAPEFPYFVVDYVNEGVADELRQPDAERAKLLTGEISQVEFAPDSSYLVIGYQQGKNELWQGGANLRRLTDLEPGKKGHYFYVGKEDKGLLVTWYANGKAYLLDLGWLEAMDGNPEALTPDDLVDVACQVFEPDLFEFLVRDEAAREFLGGDLPQLCAQTSK